MENNIKNLTLNLLKEYSFFPSKNFSQNFLINNEILVKEIELGSLTKEDHVLEIGPGLGFLTKEILSKGCKVTAIEIDEKLVEILKKEFSGYPNFNLIEGDAQKVKFPDNCNKFISNLPYSVVSKLIKKLLINKNWEIGIFIVQKEIAEKIIAKPGTKKYGFLSIISNLFSNIEIICHIPSWDFYPKPKVLSTLVKFSKIIPKIVVSDIDSFLVFCRNLFIYRKKIVRAGIKFVAKNQFNSNLSQNEILTCPMKEKRIFNLNISDLEQIYNWLMKIVGERKHE
ncbi:MAG: 16S rRNA (adenine(1518)-N(6)/adenine(1519)-N(6))-dimethyltransferase RsmA [Candidatus Ranarchaeia archaeon]